MAPSALVVLVVASLAVWVRSEAPTRPALIGVVRSPNDPHRCKLIRVNATSGANVTVADIDSACADSPATAAAAFSVAYSPSNSVVFAVDGALNAYAIAADNGAKTRVAALPARGAGQGALLGLVNLETGCASGLNFVYEHTIFVAGNLALQPIANVTLPRLALVAGAEAGGSSGCGSLFIADRASANFTTISIDPQGAGLPITMSSRVHAPETLSYDTRSDALITVARGSVYAIGATTGSTVNLTGLPQGWAVAPGPDRAAISVGGELALVGKEGIVIVDSGHHSGQGGAAGGALQWDGHGGRAAVACVSSVAPEGPFVRAYRRCLFSAQAPSRCVPVYLHRYSTIYEASNDLC